MRYGCVVGDDVCCCEEGTKNLNPSKNFQKKAGHETEGNSCEYFLADN